MGIVIDYTKGFFEASPAGETVGDISTGTLDLSSGNVFSYTPTADTTFVFNNPPASGTAQGFTLKVTGADVTSGYDLANASYDSVSFSVSGQGTAPNALFFKPDGLKLYIPESSGTNPVGEYDLSTAWDISTASYLQSFSVSAQVGAPTGIFFKSDGLKFYIVDSVSDTIYEYDLSTAWDISTASYLQSFSVSAQDAVAREIYFKPDGTKMFFVGLSNDKVYDYNLSTAWDISTASYVQNFSVASQETTPSGLFFSPTGTTFFVMGVDEDNVNEYAMSTAWDISTASYVQNFSVASQETTPTGLSFKSDGSKMYVVGSGSDTIYQYSTGTSAPATLTYPTSVDWPSGTAPDAPAVGETDVLVFYTEDGGTTYYGFQAGGAMA